MTQGFDTRLDTRPAQGLARFFFLCNTVENYTKYLQNKGTKKVDLFRLISLRGARIWPQNARTRPFFQFFGFFFGYLSRKKIQKIEKRASVSDRLISTNFDAGSSNLASERRETAGDPIFQKILKTYAKNLKKGRLLSRKGGS